MKKLGHILTCACFLVLIFSFGVYAVFSEKKTFSEMENRPLAPAPALFTDAGVNTAYYYELETRYTDTFPLRDTMLAANRRFQSLYTAVNPFAREDDIVFIAADDSNEKEKRDADAPAPTPEPTAPPSGVPSAATPTPAPAPEPEAQTVSGVTIVGDQAFELYKYDAARTERFIGYIDGLARACGVPTYVLLPPSASELFLPQKYRLPENDEKQAFDLCEASFENAVFVSLYDTFQSARDSYIYFRSDHHWTTDGAYAAYGKLGEAAGFVPAPRAQMRTGQLDGFLGSLYKKGFQDSQSGKLETRADFVRYYYPLYDTEIYNYKGRSAAKLTGGERRDAVYPDYDKDTNLYAAFFGGDTALMHMKSSVANGRSIMVVRDSYGHAFLGYLANNYEDVYAIEPRYFDSFPLASFIEAQGIDELLFLSYSLPATSGYWMDWSDELKKLT
ncbi:MAG: hypothetical protein LBT12_00585 [Oscillospiraceae bacterium]|jgi:hypothetical protein|nr:hypothetical protein [Oscillospiraceae bacterium]